MKVWRISVFFLFFFLLAGMVQAETISGTLLDGAKAPMTGRYMWNIKFYDGELSDNIIHEATGYLESDDLGFFNLRLSYPLSVLTAKEPCYVFAIDTNGDGLDSADEFEGRATVDKVPVARTADMGEQFATGVAAHRMSLRDRDPNQVLVAPFTSPGAFTFNRISMVARRDSLTEDCIVSMSIYDATGNRVLTSGPLTLINDEYQRIDAEVEGALEPGADYYSAISHIGGDIRYQAGYLQPAPGFLRFASGTATGGIPPQTLNWDDAIPMVENMSPAFNLWNAAE